ncbi:MAG: DUF2795 domain-containing protein [Desulfobacteraceae bacterium]|nr:MAG: DUF2795 domain-containing protein [Desulfobacteraceae bacterium]
MARGVGGGSPANVARFLKGIDFPAKKKDLINHAKHNDADQRVIETLNRMPDQEYGNMADVMKGYGQGH